MQATIKQNQHDGKIKQNRKENGGLLNEYAVLVPEKRKEYVREGATLRAPIIARTYCTANTVYACVWINSEPVYISGGGKAGGYGYHKASAAMDAALQDAGVTLSESIAGRGDSAIYDALAATAKALGYKKFHIHTSHA